MLRYYNGMRTARNGCATLMLRLAATKGFLQGLKPARLEIVMWELKLPPPKEKARGMATDGDEGNVVAGADVEVLRLECAGPQDDTRVGRSSKSFLQERRFAPWVEAQGLHFVVAKKKSRYLIHWKQAIGFGVTKSVRFLV
jgi:hypothetical protein